MFIFLCISSFFSPPLCSCVYWEIDAPLELPANKTIKYDSIFSGYLKILSGLHFNWPFSAARCEWCSLIIFSWLDWLLAKHNIPVCVFLNKKIKLTLRLYISFRFVGKLNSQRQQFMIFHARVADEIDISTMALYTRLCAPIVSTIFSE